MLHCSHVVNLVPEVEFDYTLRDTIASPVDENLIDRHPRNRSDILGLGNLDVAVVDLARARHLDDRRMLRDPMSGTLEYAGSISQVPPHNAYRHGCSEGKTAVFCHVPKYDRHDLGTSISCQVVA